VSPTDDRRHSKAQVPRTAEFDTLLGRSSAHMREGVRHAAAIHPSV
jgi:hypothetical protein